MAFFLALLVSSWWGVLALLGSLCVQGMGFKDVPPAGHALRAEVGGSKIFIAPGEFAGQQKILPVKIVMGPVVFMVSSCIC